MLTGPKPVTFTQTHWNGHGRIERRQQDGSQALLEMNPGGFQSYKPLSYSSLSPSLSPYPLSLSVTPPAVLFAGTLCDLPPASSFVAPQQLPGLKKRRKQDLDEWLFNPAVEAP
jgi:hypothetical protein